MAKPQVKMIKIALKGWQQVEKIKITLTNGSAPEDISDTIGEFLEKIKHEEEMDRKKQNNEQK